MAGDNPEAENLDLNAALARLQQGFVADLLKIVKSGEMTAADRNVIRQFLKDNNISSIPQAMPGVIDLAEAVLAAKADAEDD